MRQFYERTILSYMQVIAYYIAVIAGLVGMRVPGTHIPLSLSLSLSTNSRFAGYLTPLYSTIVAILNIPLCTDNGL